MKGAAPYYFIPEVAEILRCSVKTVRRRISKGAIQASKEGGRVVVYHSDLSTYLADIEARVSRP